MAHRKRGVGVARAGAAAIKPKVDALKASDLTSAVETITKLEEKLADFAKSHKNAIQKDPEFRAKFFDMCAPLGVDPLSASKSFWGSLLGLGDFYYELSVKVAEVCIASRSRNGGIIRVSEVKDILTHRGTRFQFTNTNSKHIYSEDDIIKSVKKLSKLGSGFRTITVGQIILIVSVPEELDDDHMQIMNLAEEGRCGKYGEVTIDSVSRALRWDEERVNRAFELLLGKGMIWLDVYQGGKSYWFPSLWKQDRGKVMEE